MLGSNKMVTFNGVTLVEPSRGNYVSRTKKIFREEKELGSKRVDRKQPGVPDLDSFRDRKVLFGTRVSVVTDTLNELIMAGSENFVKVSIVTNGDT